MTGAKTGKNTNRELQSMDRSNVKIDADFDGNSNAIENSVSLLFVLEK